MFNLCCQTPLEQSGTYPKPIYLFDPLLPRIVYVAWLFDSCISLGVPVQNVKGVSKWFQWKAVQLAALLRNFSAYWINFSGKGKVFHGLLYFILMLLGLYLDIAVCCSVPYLVTTYSRGEFPQKHSFTFLVNPPQPQFCILWSIAGTLYYSKTPPGLAWLCKIRALFSLLPTWWRVKYIALACS